MSKFPDDINESKAINISLTTGIFVVALLTFLELIYGTILEFIVLDPLWFKVVTLGIFMFIMLKIVKGHNKVIKIEAWLRSLKR